MNKLLSLLATLCLVAHACGATLGGVVELTPPPQWKETPVNRPASLPTVRFVPTDDRNAELLVTLFPNEIAKVEDAASLRAFHRLLCRPMLTSADQTLAVTELKMTGGAGLYTTFEDPDLVGKPPKRGDFKFATPVAIWMQPDVVLQVTLFTDEKTGKSIDEGLVLLASAKVAGKPKAFTPAPRESAATGPVRIPGIDAALVLPDLGFKPANFPDRGNGYFSYVNENGVAVSGWLDDAAGYRDFHAFWKKEKAALEKGTGFKLHDEKIKVIGAWDVATYTITAEGIVQKNLRACRVVGKTWADLHFSATVIDGRSADLEAVIKATELKKL